MPWRVRLQVDDQIGHVDERYSRHGLDLAVPRLLLATVLFFRGGDRVTLTLRASAQQAREEGCSPAAAQQ